jgi:hypothetical protein
MRRMGRAFAKPIDPPHTRLASKIRRLLRVSHQAVVVSDIRPP